MSNATRFTIACRMYGLYRRAGNSVLVALRRAWGISC